jgi:catechol 2,3-dioxygenase-like lactoylglutathione lyase family enzyme
METSLCQVALSVSDLARSRLWYEQLGLEPSGAMPPISGELPARILELPEVDIRINWLRGRDPMSQLELMHYLQPTPRPLPRDWGPRYKGYGILSLVVPDFERLLDQCRSAGTRHSITGVQGSRSLWISDPDGIAVEILEADPLGADPGAERELACIRAVTLTIPDLSKAQRFWTSAVGLTPCTSSACAFNTFPQALNGGVSEWEQHLLKGGSLIVRLLKPRRAPTLSRASDYRLSDLGVLNVAAILDSAESFSALIERVRRLGYRFTTESPMTMGDAAAIYGYDDQRVSIEVGYVLPGHESKYGWKC